MIVKGINYEGCVLSFFARSALKSKKRFSGGVLEPSQYIQVEYTLPSKPESWNQLKSASLIYSFEKIRTCYNRLQLCFYFLKMVNCVGEATKGETEIFNLLGNALKALETSNHLDQLKLFFEIRFLYVQGILPPTLQEKSIFLKCRMRDCDSVKLEKENLSWIQSQVKEALAQYLGYSQEVFLQQ